LLPDGSVRISTADVPGGSPSERRPEREEIQAETLVPGLLGL